MFASLLDNLGISSNYDNDGSEIVYNIKNSDLMQGKEFLQYERVVKTKTLNYLPFLELTTMPGLTSINEAFTGDGSLREKNKVVGQNVSENENAFNKTLSVYSTLQKEYNSTSLNGTSSSDNEMIKQLADVKDKLIYYAKKINSDMSSLQVDDESLQDYILEKQDKLNNYIQTLTKTQEQNIKLTQKSKQYHYLILIIVLIAIICLFIYILTSRLVMHSLIVLICLAIAFSLLRFQ